MIHHVRPCGAVHPASAQKAAGGEIGHLSSCDAVATAFFCLFCLPFFSYCTTRSQRSGHVEPDKGTFQLHNAAQPAKGRRALLSSNPLRNSRLGTDRDDERATPGLPLFLLPPRRDRFAMLEKTPRPHSEGRSLAPHVVSTAGAPSLVVPSELEEPPVRELLLHFEDLLPGPYSASRGQIAQVHSSGAYSETECLFVAPSSVQPIKHAGAE